MFCPRCGKPLDDNSKFCGYCGAQVFTEGAETEGRLTQAENRPQGQEQSGVTQQAQGGVTQQPQRRTQAQSRPQAQSGAQPETQTYKQGNQQSRPPGNGRRLGLLLGLIIGIVAVALVVFLLLGRKKKEEPAVAAASSVSAASSEGTPSPTPTVEATVKPTETPAPTPTESPTSTPTPEPTPTPIPRKELSGVTVLQSQPLIPTAITASSVLPPEGQFHYDPENMNDGDPRTTWVEGTGGDGIGDYLELSIPEGAEIQTVSVCPGYCLSEDLFFKNGAPTKLEISSGDKSVTLDVSALAENFERAREGQMQYLSEPVISDGTVRVTIREVRSGYKFSDTCISEVSMEGYPPYEKEQNGEVVLTDRTVTDLRGMAYILWARKLTGENSWNIPDPNASFAREDFGIPERAFAFYYFQYHMMDDRIEYVGSFEEHRAKKADLQAMMKDLFPESTEKDMEAFRDGFVMSENGDFWHMNGTGDFGAPMTDLLFDYRQTEVTTENGFLKLAGEIYNANDSSVQGTYEAYYCKTENQTLDGFVLDRVVTKGVDSAEAAAPAGGQNDETKALLETISGKDYFIGGIGSWSVILKVGKDGTFEYNFSSGPFFYSEEEGVDGDYWSGNMTGRFVNAKKISDTIYTVELSDLNIPHPEGEEWYDELFGGDKFHYISYGVSFKNGDEIPVFLAGTPTNEIRSYDENIVFLEEDSVTGENMIVFGIYGCAEATF